MLADQVDLAADGLRCRPVHTLRKFWSGGPLTGGDIVYLHRVHPPEGPEGVYLAIDPDAANPV